MVEVVVWVGVLVVVVLIVMVMVVVGGGWRWLVLEREGGGGWWLDCHQVFTLLCKLPGAAQSPRCDPARPDVGGGTRG